MKYVFVMIAVFSLSFQAFSQDLVLEDFLVKAEGASLNYVETFKNLVAEESKTIIKYKKNGSISDMRQIKSNFIVYQSEKSKAVSEFRTVFEYNGKNVAENDDDVVKFFQKLSSSENSEEEFKKVKKQSLRYDGGFLVWGMTLAQDFLLRTEVRKIFDYKLIGKELIEGKEAYLIEYRQKEYSTLILVNPSKDEEKIGRGFQFDTYMSDSFQPTNPRLNGKMLLDAETGQMWKNEFEVTIQPQNVTKPIVTNQSSYEYQASKFGIFVPKAISITSFEVSGKPTKKFTVSKLSNFKAEYSKFTSLDSEVKDYKTDTKP